MEIQISHLKKDHKKKTVLEDIVFDAKSGEIVCITGAKGSGQTTLMNLLAGVDKPTGGKVLIDGKNLFAVFRKPVVKIGYIPQTNPLPDSMSVGDCFKLWKPTKDDMMAMIDEYELGDYLNQNAGALSGGMKRKTAIACVLAGKPDILLLDEPTAALDVIYKKQIQNSIKSYAKNGGIVIMVSHDADEFGISTRILTIENGCIA